MKSSKTILNKIHKNLSQIAKKSSQGVTLSKSQRRQIDRAMIKLGLVANDLEKLVLVLE